MPRMNVKNREIESVKKMLHDARNNLKMSASARKIAFWSGQVHLHAQELARLEGITEDAQAVPVSELGVVADPETELTGGRVNYYLASVNNPQREEQPGYIAECEDIIQALDMTFDEGCLFKALWRTASARLGNGKPGQKAVYDAEKMVHYAGRILTKTKREAN